MHHAGELSIDLMKLGIKMFHRKHHASTILIRFLLGARALRRPRALLRRTYISSYMYVVAKEYPYVFRFHDVLECARLRRNDPGRPTREEDCGVGT